ncbi:uncharacterized protein BDZ99DRAFT_19448 [Mytilinidion resinicola]|uniref:Uncharacterized protein n=1 Tax=Mytilinidion resinicola TaxID=574789 RepID=A0A6A6ZBI9_9PEZI|nr:uncharacterized protein BDZ99DRAFT_19448 [Mytilinidion resinicola]KAF2817587.1 hypothetical protein BDZ99DRAFT_19448 [Mytilinidion resinicola]
MPRECITTVFSSTLSTQYLPFPFPPTITQFEPLILLYAEFQCLLLFCISFCENQNTPIHGATDTERADLFGAYYDQDPATMCYLFFGPPIWMGVDLDEVYRGGQGMGHKRMEWRRYCCMLFVWSACDAYQVFNNPTSPYSEANAPAKGSNKWRQDTAMFSFWKTYSDKARKQLKLGEFEDVPIRHGGVSATEKSEKLTVTLVPSANRSPQ